MDEKDLLIKQLQAQLQSKDEQLQSKDERERSAKYILSSVVGSMVLFPFTQELNHGSFYFFEQSRVLATGS
jgi:hypothetical protein